MSRPSSRALGLGLALLTGVAYVGCAASSTTDAAIPTRPSMSDAGRPDVGAGGDGGSPSGSGATSGKGGMPAITTIITTSEAGASGAGDSCAAAITTAQVVPLDMYIMLDVSGSMLDSTSNYDSKGVAITKWAAVKNALESFIDDDASKGLGVGIQYFPVLKPNVPATCASNADCGEAAPCALNFCAISEDVCDTDADCPLVGFGGHNVCIPIAYCAGTLCYQVGNDPYDCTQANDAVVPCVAITTSHCAQPTKCDAASYATPAEPIATLPDAAPALVASIEGQLPSLNSTTPTGPALSGAVTAASTWAKAHPERRVVTVLATDGIPTDCTPTTIAGVAKIAANGLASTPQINTFTIGVFSVADAPEGQATLDQIALSGGTKSAFVLTTTDDVTVQFRAALDAIRSTQLGCEFQIPQPDANQTIDYSLVNLNYKSGKQTSTLLYVADIDHCDPLKGGWYYDVDPNVGNPSRIEVCPTTCDTFQSSAGASVEIAVGCQTIVK